jgi:hypothetical protein
MREGRKGERGKGRKGERERHSKVRWALKQSIEGVDYGWENSVSL